MRSISLLHRLIFVAAIFVALSSAPLTAPAQAETVDSICLRLLDMDCPSFDFFWRPGEPGLLSYITRFGAPEHPESWVSIVAPMQTYFAYSPMPIHEPFEEYGVFYSQVNWVGWVSFWGCDFDRCPPLPIGYARLRQHHVVPVRQILPVSIGD